MRTRWKLTSALLMSLLLTGCVPDRCASDASTPTDAVAGLLHDLPGAKTPADICQYVSFGWVVSQAELEQLQDDWGGVSDNDVALLEGEQMAATVPVQILVNGVVVHVFSTLGDDHNGHWTVDLGHVGAAVSGG
jgi:hypothetical protein